MRKDIIFRVTQLQTSLGSLMGVTGKCLMVKRGLFWSTIETFYDSPAPSTTFAVAQWSPCFSNAIRSYARAMWLAHRVTATAEVGDVGEFPFLETYTTYRLLVCMEEDGTMSFRLLEWRRAGWQAVRRNHG